MADILLKNILAVNDKESKRCDILIENGKIAEIGDVAVDADTVIDGENLCVMPGLFDMHVHFRDPGFTHKEDILTGSAAALAGGITGVLCMPNTNPPIDNPETIKYIEQKAKGTGVDVYLTACVTKGMNSAELCDYSELLSETVIAVTDDGKPVKNAELLRQALEISNENGMLVCSHCEDMDIIGKGIIHKGEISKKLNVAGMDRASEDSITAREIAIASSENARIHICHVSTKGSVEIIRDAKKRGVKVTCETCSHYFTYTDEKLTARDADYRMNPPLREESDRLAIIEGILDGTIDCIVTDHAPHSSEEKSDFEKAPNGVVGLETSLAVTLTQLYHTGKISLEKIAALMSANPRKILNIQPANIEVGESANLAVVDLDKEWTVVPNELHSKSKNTVFKGEKLKGKVVYTISEGLIRYKEN